MFRIRYGFPTASLDAAAAFMPFSTSLRSTKARKSFAFIIGKFAKSEADAIGLLTVGIDANHSIGMSANDDIKGLLELAQAVGRARGWKLSTVSLYAAQSGSLFNKMDGGQVTNLTIARRDAITKKLRALLAEDAA